MPENKRTSITTLGAIASIIALIIGSNWYEQATGRYVFEDIQQRFGIGFVREISPSKTLEPSATHTTIASEAYVESQQAQPSETSSECIPPSGLIPLWQNIEPPWSKGIWGSANMPNFMVALGEIDANDPDFGEFQIWIDPCSVPWHDYIDGGRFWPQQQVGITAPPIPLGGENATTVILPAKTGIWGLGPRY